MYTDIMLQKFILTRFKNNIIPVYRYRSFQIYLQYSTLVLYFKVHISSRCWK